MRIRNSTKIQGKEKGEIKKMLEKLWDDVVAGPQPEHGLEKLRRISTTRGKIFEHK